MRSLRWMAVVLGLIGGGAALPAVSAPVPSAAVSGVSTAAEAQPLVETVRYGWRHRHHGWRHRGWHRRHWGWRHRGWRRHGGWHRRHWGPRYGWHRRVIYRPGFYGHRRYRW